MTKFEQYLEAVRKDLKKNNEVVEEKDQKEKEEKEVEEKTKKK